MLSKPHCNEPRIDGPWYGEPTALEAGLWCQVRAPYQPQEIPHPFAVPPDGPAKRGGLSARDNARGGSLTGRIWCVSLINKREAAQRRAVVWRPTEQAAPLSCQVRAPYQPTAIPHQIAVPPDGPAMRGGPEGPRSRTGDFQKRKVVRCQAVVWRTYYASSPSLKPRTGGRPGPLGK